MVIITIVLLDLNQVRGCHSASISLDARDVVDLCFDPDSGSRLVTIGVRHACVWNVSRESGLHGAPVRWGHLSYGDKSLQEIATSFCSIAPYRGGQLCGAYDGSIHVCLKGVFLRRVRAHTPSPCLSIVVDRDRVLSAGTDDIILWPLSMSQETRNIEIEPGRTVCGLALRRRPGSCIEEPPLGVVAY